MQLRARKDIPVITKYTITLILDYYSCGLCHPTSVLDARKITSSEKRRDARKLTSPPT